MNDYIKISGLEVYANHGVFPEENKLGQKFVISIKMCLDLSKASENDDLKQSVDYGEICGRVTQFTQNNTFKLIETLAYGITENWKRRSFRQAGVRNAESILFWRVHIRSSFKKELLFAG